MSKHQPISLSETEYRYYSSVNILGNNKTFLVFLFFSLFCMFIMKVNFPFLFSFVMWLQSHVLCSFTVTCRNSLPLLSLTEYRLCQKARTNLLKPLTPHGSPVVQLPKFLGKRRATCMYHTNNGKHHQLHVQYTLYDNKNLQFLSASLERICASTDHFFCLGTFISCGAV